MSGHHQRRAGGGGGVLETFTRAFRDTSTSGVDITGEVQAGDLIVSYLTRKGTIPSLPSGFTNLETSPNDDINGRVCCKISDGTETAAGTVGSSGQATTFVLRGNVPIDTFTNHASNSDSGGSVTSVSQSTSGVTTPCVLFGFTANEDDNGGGESMTPAADEFWDTNASNNVHSFGFKFYSEEDTPAASVVASKSNESGTETCTVVVLELTY